GWGRGRGGRARWPRRPGAPVPSTSVPPRIRRSKCAPICCWPPLSARSPNGDHRGPPLELLGVEGDQWKAESSRERDVDGISTPETQIRSESCGPLGAVAVDGHAADPPDANHARHDSPPQAWIL